MDNKKATLELGTEPVGKLLARYALPAIIAMTAASLYNIIDRVFIGQVVGPLAISGLAITFPFMNLAAAFGAAVGVGASTTISVRLGQRDYDAAENILGNTITLNLIIGIGFGLFSLMFLDPILRFFGASDDTLPYAHDFMTIILAGNVISHMYFGMNAVLRAASKPKKAMAATLFTVVMNVVLDAVFILWWHWGIKGAALATMISQLLALCWQMSIFANQKELLHLKRGIYKLRAELVQNIISIGISPFLMNACACIIVIFMNNQLVRYGGDMAVGAYGIANSIAMVFVLFSMGLNQGMQPIAGYNFGAKQYPRVTQVLKITIYAATIVTTIGFLMGMFIPQLAVSIFTTHEELVNISAKGLRIVVMFFPIVGFQMVTSNFFQSIGMASKAIFLSISRQVLVLIPCLLILPRFYGQLGVWISMPISDLIASLIAGGMLWWQFRQFRKATA